MRHVDENDSLKSLMNKKMGIIDGLQDKIIADDVLNQ